MASSDSDSDVERVILTPRRRIKWKELEISEAFLLQDWRIRTTFHKKNCDIVEYYCAHGKQCPAKVKKKILPNEVVVFTTNGSKHSNHRSCNHGLTEEDKKVVVDCLKSGVTATGRGNGC